MSRSIWKGPNSDVIYRKALKAIESNSKTPIVMYDRAQVVLPMCTGLVFDVYNGKTMTRVKIIDSMIGHRLGEFSPTRVFKGHSGDQKSKKRSK